MRIGRLVLRVFFQLILPPWHSLRRNLSHCFSSPSKKTTLTVPQRMQSLSTLLNNFFIKCDAILFVLFSRIQQLSKTRCLGKWTRTSDGIVSINGSDHIAKEL